MCFFGKFQPLQRAKIHKNQILASKCVEMADFALLESAKLISRKL